jgi:hypothetical protein
MGKFNLFFYVFACLVLFLSGITLARQFAAMSPDAFAGSFGFAPGSIDLGELQPGASARQTMTLMRGSAERAGTVDIWIRGPVLASWLTIEHGRQVPFPKGEQRIEFDILLEVPVDAQAGNYQSDLEFVLRDGGKEAAAKINLGGQARVFATVTSAVPAAPRWEAADLGLYSSLRGRFLTASSVNSLYYADPRQDVLFGLPDKAAMDELVAERALGISNITLSLIEPAFGTSGPLSLTSWEEEYSRLVADRLAGLLFLQVEERGELWYVNPADLKRYYLGVPEKAWLEAARLAREVSEADLIRLKEGVN